MQMPNPTMPTSMQKAMASPYSPKAICAAQPFLKNIPMAAINNKGASQFMVSCSDSTNKINNVAANENTKVYRAIIMCINVIGNTRAGILSNVSWLFQEKGQAEYT